MLDFHSVPICAESGEFVRLCVISRLSKCQKYNAVELALKLYILYPIIIIMAKQTSQLARVNKRKAKQLCSQIANCYCCLNCCCSYFYSCCCSCHFCAVIKEPQAVCLSLVLNDFRFAGLQNW